MADLGGTLTFTFDADLTAFSRAVDSAGAKLDALSQRTSAFAAGQPLTISNGLGTSGDDQAGRELTRLSQQLALLQSTGTAHAAIAEQRKITAAQAKLGSDATEAQKDAATALVQQIDAATAAQTRLRAAQQADNTASRFAANTLTGGIEAMIFQGAGLKDVAASMLTSVSRAGLSAAIAGSGPLAGILGTAGSGGAPGGLFGALGTLLTGSASASSSFSGLYADGGSIGAGQWGVVGEKGAEIVAGPATVTPWAKAAAQAGGGRSTQVIQFNVTTPDAPSFARSESQMAALVSRAVARGGRNA
jgi:hypothetical protein